ncbi:sensor histidine kinase [Xanthocytophaga agilis]|uniref:histidine kinase n=1 Tax=Xanthocytophaga agilis TaxID=3048010 RepID=A0AAE3R7H1_9BACT|nr:ATP-binding protein [Xanthocytophaga agilis]MDJ1504590.1 ATP-binding protein [Xanthocytophaga agilis]
MFRTFSAGLIIRVLALVGAIFASCYTFLFSFNYLVAVAFLLLISLQTYNLYFYVDGTNRKLIRFLESVRWSDFSIGFAADNKLGYSFRVLNQQFNEVLDAFRQARAEREANLQYLNAVVHHVSVGLLAFDTEGNVELVNNAALKLLGIYRLRTLSDLQKTHPELVDLVQKLRSQNNGLYQTPSEQQLSVYATVIRLRGKTIKLVSLQNIQSELQQKELEAWQNLTRVLRHEIMNSITPITSLIATMQDIVTYDLDVNSNNSEAVGDLKEALRTIENRSVGLLNFVNAYRNFTNIPKPDLAEMQVRELVGSIVQLMQTDAKNAGVNLSFEIQPADLSVLADNEQIEMVLINLIKNAVEALSGKEEAFIQIRGYKDENQQVSIDITDNGPGIIPEALEKIFIPFYTTKKTGSGIGLSLSRQIMQMHGGLLKVASEVNEGTTFTLKFNS